MKTCSKCKIEKSKIEFSKCTARADGLQNYCRVCSRSSNSKWQKENPEKIAVNTAAYRERHAETIVARKKAYYKSNRKRVLLKSSLYYEENRERVAVRGAKYRAVNIVKIRERTSAYYEANREKVIATTMAYERARKKTDPIYAMMKRVRRALCSALSNRGYSKKSKTQDILGCTYEEFKEHLENQFTPGMSWDNRDEWHIDHIHPVSLATTEEELLRLNHYTNLQPLWAKDNLKKGNKIIKNKSCKLT